MTADFLAPFAQLVASRIGVRIGSLGDSRLLDQVERRIKIQAGGNPTAYLALLQADTSESQLEWDQLIPLVTNGETFFFRDQGQFALLKETILPTLIEQAGEKRSLRLWSAGCSTGEEPYSLAILLNELLPPKDEWDLWILATDLNVASLERAREGLYGRWSFRLVSPDLMSTYFRARAESWALDPRIREMVTFRKGNLLDEFAGCRSTDMFQWDLILCRNVFLYFDDAGTAAVMSEFRKLLRPGGYLMTGHNELKSLDWDGFAIRSFPESVLYQRVEKDPMPCHAAQPLLTMPYDRRDRTARGLSLTSELPVVADGLPSSDLPEATLAANHTLQLDPNNLEALRLMAQACANEGRYRDAMAYCRRALVLDYADVPSHFLLAKVAEEQGDLEAARAALEKAIYLDPSFIPAHLELAFLYEHTGNKPLARNQFRAAAELLRALPSGAFVDGFEDVPAGALLGRIAGLLEEGSDSTTQERPR